MPLMVGAHRGRYQIVGALGAGGMGEVYRARDTKLGRDVAIKVLPDVFAEDPERSARFHREAQLLAALNHPGVAAIYGLEESGSTRFLVLELVDGETLARYLQHSTARNGLPLGEALGIVRQIVDALEAAHDKGIVHRDLKPSNVMLTGDGQVKVLDFGLAKALNPAAESPSGSPGRPAVLAGLSHSPTLTAGGTQTGVILGTAAYMAPEQAKGRAADKRSDIWAFGCVLYEMLTGRAVFGGGSVTEVLARILEREPDWTALPQSLPSSLRRLLRRSLEKDRRRRLSDIADARLEIEEALAGRELDRPAPVQPTASRRSTLPVAVLLLAIGVAAAGAAAAWRYAAPDTPAEETRFEVAPPPGTIWAPSPVASTTQLALSPDGRRLAFIAAATRGAPQIWIRALDSIQSQALAGTDGGSFPFWSPDSRSIGFFADGKLKLRGSEAAGRRDSRGRHPVRSARNR